MDIRAVVFDMDGTILHTLPDLTVITNKALEQMGFPQHTEQEVLTFVGNGAERLIDQAVPAYATQKERKSTLELWRKIYFEYGNQRTAPFPGIPELLDNLRAKGIKTAVLSNKFDAAVRQLADTYFPSQFDVARGEIAPIPRKPDPTSLLQIIDELGVTPQQTAYVGDTNVDVQVACNAGTLAIGVTWGYEAAIPMDRTRLDYVVSKPDEILQLVVSA